MTYLKTKREQLGLTKSELASRAGIPLTTYYRVELYDLRSHRYGLVEQIANALDMNAYELVTASTEYAKESDS